MFAKLSYSMSVMRASWNVLKRSPGLMLFPLLSTGACLLVIASFAGPLLMTRTHGSAGNPFFFRDHSSSGSPQPAYSSPLHYAVLFAFYFCNYFVITFFNSALVACAVVSLRGGKPDLAFGLREAFARIHLIAGWALLSATVGVVLRAIEERASFLGRIVASLLGLSWALASYLAVPVLIMENLGPIEAVKRSSEMLRKTWGERIAGSAGLGIVFVLLMLPAIAIVAAGFSMSLNGNYTPVIVAAGVAILYIVLLSLVQSTLSSIFKAAVYLYASEPQSPANSGNQGYGFPVGLLSNAIGVKA